MALGAIGQAAENYIKAAGYVKLTLEEYREQKLTFLMNQIGEHPTQNLIKTTIERAFNEGFDIANEIKRR